MTRSVRRPLKPPTGMVSSTTSKPLPSLCSHTAPSSSQRAFSPSLLTECALWEGSFFSVVAVMVPRQYGGSFLVLTAHSRNGKASVSRPVSGRPQPAFVSRPLSQSAQKCSPQKCCHASASQL